MSASARRGVAGPGMSSVHDATVLNPPVNLIAGWVRAVFPERRKIIFTADPELGQPGPQGDLRIPREFGRPFHAKPATQFEGLGLGKMPRGTTGYLAPFSTTGRGEVARERLSMRRIKELLRLTAGVLA